MEFRCEKCGHEWADPFWDLGETAYRCPSCGGLKPEPLYDDMEEEHAGPSERRHTRYGTTMDNRGGH